MSTEKNPYQKICKYKFCQKEFKASRSNQKYCCRKHYIMHNNAKAKAVRDATKDRDYTFHKNWLILKRLHTAGTREIDRITLEKEGYELGVCTHSWKIAGTSRYVLFCYDFGLEMTEDKNYKILKNEP
jgi:hypothetical protein